MATIDLLRLPTDIFGEIAEALAALGLKRTLLELSLACHDVRAVSPPALMRRIDVTETNVLTIEQQFTDRVPCGDLVRKAVFAASVPFVSPTRFAEVEEIYRLPRCVSAILKGCPNMKELRFEAALGDFAAVTFAHELLSFADDRDRAPYTVRVATHALKDVVIFAWIRPGPRGTTVTVAAPEMRGPDVRPLLEEMESSFAEKPLHGYARVEIRGSADADARECLESLPGVTVVGI
ncbi:hypothetical protein DFJ74DRAFT_678805 [Hyaloraphidium curvatum]|nr:hypothetical protein DFJ74DRAFT_678805 [Hyaloraphidium curvatum]